MKLEAREISKRGPGATRLAVAVGSVLLAAQAMGQEPPAEPAAADESQVAAPEAGAAPAAEQAADQQAAAEPSKTPEGLERIEVTGSRIAREGYSAPTPVTITSTEDLLRVVPTNLPDAINRLPQFAMSSGPSRSTHNFANTASHGNILNLRGVGGNRTLILFDGRRVPPTTFRGDVDSNVIPNLLVERVEVVTGGASAAYGSDAVAGVVNFVLDEDFEGFKGSAQIGTSVEGDNDNYRVAGAWGGGFADGAGHALVSAEIFSNDGMLRSDRKIGREGWLYAGSVPGCTSPTPGACSPGGSANPYTLVKDSRLVVSTNRGLILSGPAGFPFTNYTFLPDGSYRPFNRGTATGSPIFAIGGDGYTIPYDVSAVAPLDTTQAFGRVTYEFSPAVTGFVDGIFSRSELEYTSLANSWTGLTSAPIFSGNPFLPAEMQAALGPNDVISVGQYYGDGAKPKTDEQTDFMSITAGLEGEFGDGWKWDASYSWGDSTHHMEQSGLYDWQRAYAAVDAVRDTSGNIVCRATLDPDPAIRQRFAGCRPMNILGVDPAVATPDGYDYARGTSKYTAGITQNAVAVNLSGSLFELPAGPVDMAVGGEYRMQKLELRSNADPALLDTPAERAAHFVGLRGVHPSALFYWLTNVGIADGDVDVTEGYVELNVPILADLPAFDRLELNGAMRVTDYSTSGTVDTWKAGLQWAVTDWLKFRGVVSRDIRAPTLFDLFAGDQSAIGTVFDPVTGLQQNVPQIIGGNPLLEPEEADTESFGVVFEPSFVPGFALSVDYWKIEINDAIGTLTAQQILNNCAASGGSAPECDLITRPAPDEFPTSIRQAPANVAFVKTSGIDFDARYTTPAGPGDLSLRLIATYLDSYESQQFEGAPVLDFQGIATATSTPEGRPDWRGMLNVNYDIGQFGIFLSEQYIGDMKVSIPGAPNEFADHASVGSTFYTDVTFTYRPDFLEGVEFFATVNNLFDEDPPIIPGTVPGVNLPTVYAVYDTIGMAFSLGARARF